jgi:hypothetical protein
VYTPYTWQYHQRWRGNIETDLLYLSNGHWTSEITSQNLAKPRHCVTRVSYIYCRPVSVVPSHQTTDTDWNVFKKGLTFGPTRAEVTMEWRMEMTHNEDFNNLHRTWGSNIGGCEEFYLPDITKYNRLKVKDQRIIQTRNEHNSGRKQRYWLLAGFILRPWRWRRHVPPKSWLSFSGLHTVMSPKS